MRERSPLALLAFLGGAIASLEESWIDSLIKLRYPRDAPLVIFTAAGTPQPLYLHLIYPGFVGLGAYAVYLGLRSRHDARPLWIGLIAIAVLDLAFELPATAGHVFSYYGPQPLQLVDHGWPAWVAPINGAGPVLGGWLLYRLAPRLRGADIGLAALLPPFAYAGVYGATGWPVFTLLNSHVPSALRWLAAGLTLALCLGLIRVLSLTLGTRPTSSHGDRATSSEANRVWESLAARPVASGGKFT
jgi:hypothetical protein